MKSITMRYDATHKTRTRERVLEQAASGFREQGIGNLSIAGLMKSAGLTHGGFYSHFASKEALLQEAIEYAFGDVQGKLHENIQREPRGARTKALVRAYLSAEHLLAIEAGCPLAALGSELARQSDDVREVAAIGTRRLSTMVAAALKDDDLSLCPEALTATLVGALLMARLAPSPAAGSALCRSVVESISQWIDAAREPSSSKG